MVGYYKKLHILLMVLGAVCGLGLAYIQERGIGSMVLFPLAGAALGRIACGAFANRQVNKWNDILFRQGEPETFLQVFAPVMERTSPKTPEYVDGCNKMAYAWEAMGDFEKAASYLENLKVSDLNINGQVTTCSNLTRIYLLQENLPAAEAALEHLREAYGSLTEKQKKLAYAGKHYARLYENWLLVLQEEDADLEFLREEIRLSSNRIRSSELQLVLAKAYADDGDGVMAEEMLMDAMTTGMGLWAEKRARSLLRGE